MTEHECTERGLDWVRILPSDAPDRIRAYAPRFRDLLLSTSEEAIRRRPEPGVWSALEYTVHMCDVWDILLAAIERSRAEDLPFTGTPDQDQRAVDQHWNDHLVEDVLGRLDAAAAVAAEAAEKASRDDLARLVRTGGGHTTNVLVMIQGCIHEAHHHLWDVQRVLAAVADLLEGFAARESPAHPQE